METIITHSEKETSDYGKAFAKTLKGGDIVLLGGNLGCGKTALTKGIANGLGVKETVLSPTFTIMNEYQGVKYKLYHYDAYRLKCVEEAEEAGLMQYFNQNDAICVVEWYENIKQAFCGLKTIKIAAESLGETTRRFIIE